MTGSSGHSSLKRKREKVSAACKRCRTKKLKCDSARPCKPCAQGDFPCEDEASSPRSNHKADRALQDQSAIDKLLNRSHEAGDTYLTAGQRQKAARKAYLSEFSVLDLTRLLFENYGSGASLNAATSAIPGGSTETDPGRSANVYEDKVSLTEALGLQLPPKDFSPKLHIAQSLTHYEKTFDEESVKTSIDRIVTDNQIFPSETNSARFYIVILALGAYYQSMDADSNVDPEISRTMHVSMLSVVEASFLDILGAPSVESVQICILVGSFHLFNGRPGVGFGILGSGIKLAQAIGLHREKCTRGNDGSVTLQTRRKIWWALEIYEKYAAVAYGRPCAINDSDCDVGEIEDGLAEPSTSQVYTQHNFGSITYLTYHRLKCRLYRIMGPFLGRMTQTNRLESVRTINNKLTTWFQELPRELRVDICQDSQTSGLSPGIDLTVFQMQAVALQLAYDNLQSVLHRFAAFTVGSSGGFTTTQLNVSRNQLLKSAMRTANLEKYPKIMRRIQSTHAANHVGICCLTAGVMLCALVLTDPQSPRTDEAVRAISSIVKMHMAGDQSQHLLSAQGVQILGNLVLLITRTQGHDGLRNTLNSMAPLINVTKTSTSSNSINQSSRNLSMEDSGDQSVGPNGPYAISAVSQSVQPSETEDTRASDEIPTSFDDLLDIVYSADELGETLRESHFDNSNLFGGEQAWLWSDFLGSSPE